MKTAALLIVCNSDHYLDKWFANNVKMFDYICVSEGATQNWMNALGWNQIHSIDQTNNIIDKWQARHPEKIFVYRHNKPFTEKQEQQNYALSLVPDDTDYIWILDADEFYHYGTVNTINDYLYNNGPVNIKMMQYHFFKRYDHVARGGNGWGYDTPQDRIFYYEPGCRFSNHRPITLVKGGKVLCERTHINNTRQCFHYSYTFQREVYEKMLYYSVTFNHDYINKWYKPFYEKWNELTREELEKNFSAHPSVSGGYTEKINLIHPIDL